MLRLKLENNDKTFIKRIKLDVKAILWWLSCMGRVVNAEEILSY